MNYHSIGWRDNNDGQAYRDATAPHPSEVWWDNLTQDERDKLQTQADRYLIRGASVAQIYRLYKAGKIEKV